MLRWNYEYALLSTFKVCPQQLIDYISQEFDSEHKIKVPRDIIREACVDVFTEDIKNLESYPKEYGAEVVKSLQKALCVIIEAFAENEPQNAYLTSRLFDPTWRTPIEILTTDKTIEEYYLHGPWISATLIDDIGNGNGINIDDIEGYINTLTKEFMNGEMPENEYREELQNVENLLDWIIKDGERVFQEAVLGPLYVVNSEIKNMVNVGRLNSPNPKMVAAIMEQIKEKLQDRATEGQNIMKHRKKKEVVISVTETPLGKSKITTTTTAEVCFKLLYKILCWLKKLGGKVMNDLPKSLKELNDKLNNNLIHIELQTDKQGAFCGYALIDMSSGETIYSAESEKLMRLVMEEVVKDKTMLSNEFLRKE